MTVFVPVAVTAAVGVLIGAVGIGGVVLAPALTLAGVMNVHQAVATSSWCFMFTGFAGTAGYLAGGEIPWPLLRRLAVGLLPGAAAGAVVNGLLPTRVVLTALTVLTLLATASMFTPRSNRPPRPDRRTLRPATAIATGACVGFGSALTGTGGPVLLIPVLLAMGIGLLPSVAVSQAAQFLVTSAASVGYLGTTPFDLPFASLLGVIAAAGTLCGTWLARHLDLRVLRYVVTAALAGTAVLLLIRTVVTFLI